MQHFDFNKKKKCVILIDDKILIVDKLPEAWDT